MLQYLTHIGILLLIRIVIASGMNLYFGYAGVIGLSQVAFFGIGVYVGANVLLSDGGLWIALLLGGLASFVFSFLIGLTSIRLRHDYLGIATFGFFQIMLTVAYTWTDFTNGALGLNGVSRPAVFGLDTSNTITYFFLVLTVSAILMFFLYRLIKAPFGRVLEAIRDDEDAAKSIGIKTTYYKLAAFCIGATMAGLIGVLYGPYLNFIGPNEFIVDALSIQLVVIMVGGIGTFRGPIIGAIFITLLLESVRYLNVDPVHLGSIQMMVYSCIFLISLRFFPQGIGGYLQHKGSNRKHYTSY